MEEFAAILKTLETLRNGEDGVVRSVSRIEQLPRPDEISWCIERLSAVSLSEVPAAEHVTSLYLVECPKLETLSGIAEKFPLLETLWVYSCDRLNSLDGLQCLEALEVLTIWPSFTGSLTVETLAPLAGAARLRSLVFSGRSRDGSLAALYGLERLSRVFLSNNFAWDEFARFEAHQPDVAFPWKGGVVHDANPGVLTCQSCGKPQAMLTGRGLRLCCPDCDAGRLSKHLSRYAKLTSSG